MGKRKPSDAQARTLAMMWGGAFKPAYVAGINPTLDVCMRNGWIKGNGVVGTFPAGSQYEGVAVTMDGIAALGVHLMGIYHLREPAGD